MQENRVCFLLSVQACWTRPGQTSGWWADVETFEYRSIAAGFVRAASLSESLFAGVEFEVNQHLTCGKPTGSAQKGPAVG